MNFWFPHINSRGETVSGSGQMELIAKDGQLIKSLGTGWRPRWIDDDSIVYNSGSSSVIMNVRTNAKQDAGQGYNQIESGGGLWLGLLQSGPIYLRLYQGTQLLREWQGCGNPSISRNGRRLHTDRYHDGVHTVFVDDVPVYEGAVMEASICNAGVVINVATGAYTRQCIVIPTGGAQADSSIQSWESPQAVDGPNGELWVLSVLQNGLALRKAGSSRGYFWPGEWFNPSARLLDGQFMVAASSSGGHRQVVFVNPASDPTSDLIAPPATPQPPTQPPPTPTQPPSEPPKPMKIPAAVSSIIHKFVEKFPLPQTPGGGEEHENKCRAWMKMLAEQIVFSTSDPTWGLKKSGEHNPQSKDALARMDPTLICWDLMAGAGTGFPRLADDPEFHDIPTQIFIPVSAVNHLGVTPVPGPTPTPDPTPVPEQPSCDCKNRVAKLEVEVSLLNEKMKEAVASLNSFLDELDTMGLRVQEAVALANKPLKLVPTSAEDRAGITIGTSKTFGHAHAIRVKLERE